MRNSSTSNAASCRTTVSNIAFISWESIRWPSASTTSELGIWNAECGMFVTNSKFQIPNSSFHDAPSVRERVQDDVDTDGVAVRREFVEVFLALALALPGVGNVGVVRHHDHQSAVVVGDPAEVDGRTVTTALRCAAGLNPEADVRDLLDRFHVVEHVHDRMVARDVLDRILVRRQHTPDLVLPLIPRPRAPEVVDDDEAALLEIRAQAVDLIVAEADDARVLHVQDR